jgi:hypothetical protein
MSLSLAGANQLTYATSGALAIGSTTSQFSTGATINYTILGRHYSKAATATQAFVIEPNTGIVPTAPNTLQTLVPFLFSLIQLVRSLLLKAILLITDCLLR